MEFRRVLFRSGMASAVASPAIAQSRAVQAANDVTLSVGTGQLVSLDGTMSDVFVANDAIADVQVRSADQIYIFGKGPGQTTVFATNRAGKVIYSADVRVGNRSQERRVGKECVRPCRSRWS